MSWEGQSLFLMLLAAVPFAGLAAGGYRLSRDIRGALRWELLCGFAGFVCLHLWSELAWATLGLQIARAVPPLLLLAGYGCLYGFALSGMKASAARRKISWGLAIALLAGGAGSVWLDEGELGVSLVAGFPATLGAAWAILSWRRTTSAGIGWPAWLMAALLPMVAVAGILSAWGWWTATNVSGIAQPWQCSATYALIGLGLALGVAGLCARAIAGTRGSAGVRRYVIESIVMAIIAAGLLILGYAAGEGSASMQLGVVQREAEGRDRMFAESINHALHTSESVAADVAANADVIHAAAAPSDYQIAVAQASLRRAARVYNVEILVSESRTGRLIGAGSPAAPEGEPPTSLVAECLRMAANGLSQTTIVSEDQINRRRVLAARPIRIRGREVAGVAMVRADLGGIQANFPTDAVVMLVDAAGEVCLSTQEKWNRLRLWNIASPAQAIAAADTRFSMLPRAPWNSGDEVSFAKQLHRVSRIPAGPAGWTIISLMPLDKVLYARGVMLGITACGLVITMMVGTLLRTHGETREIEQRQQVMRHTMHEMERLVSVLSHDLRSPLAASKATIDYLLLREGLDADTACYLQSVGDQQLRMADLVNRMLDVMRIRSGAMEWSWGLVNIPATLANARDVIASLPEKSTGVDLELSIAQNLSTMRGDAQAITRLIVNLGSNAVKHTPKGAVAISAEPIRDDAGLWLRLTVRDSGGGMDQRTLERLGKPFALGGHSSSAASAGLGLTIAAGICAAHGGRLAASTTPGKGSVFTAYLRMDLPAPIRTAGDQTLEILAPESSPPSA